MILYNLKCDRNHLFETWFRDSTACDQQAAAGDIQCPVCGSAKVEKAIMAPRVAGPAGRGRAPDEAPPGQGGETRAPVAGATAKAMLEAERSGKIRQALGALRRQIEENCDYVGPRFAEEARKVHYGEVEERAIYGETTAEEARKLDEEGVQVQRIPWLPRESS